MKGRLVVKDRYQGRAAAALVVDGRLEDVLIDPPEGADPLPGRIVRAIADRPIKGLGGQFLRLPDGAQGFLRNGPNLPPGRAVDVQVSGFAEPGKAVPVSHKLLFKGRFAILTPGAPGINVSRQIRDEDRRDALQALVADRFADVTGLILRSAAQYADDLDIVNDISALCEEHAAAGVGEASKTAQWLTDGVGAHRHADIEWLSEEAQISHSFRDHEIEDMIDAMRQPFARLKTGSAYIEPTRALVAVDVNTDGDTSPAAGLKANLALCHDLPGNCVVAGLAGRS